MFRIIVASMTAFGGGCATAPCTFDRNAIALSVTARPGAVVAVTFVNSTDRTIKLYRTHGVSAQGLRLSVRSSSGLAVPYPRDLPEVTLGAPPEAFCLGPRQSYEWIIPLRAFPMEYGGRAGSNTYAFDVKPGPYEVRATYRDRCLEESCAEVESAWTVIQID